MDANGASQYVGESIIPIFGIDKVQKAVALSVTVCTFGVLYLVHIP